MFVRACLLMRCKIAGWVTEYWINELMHDTNNKARDSIGLLHLHRNKLTIRLLSIEPNRHGADCT